MDPQSHAIGLQQEQRKEMDQDRLEVFSARLEQPMEGAGHGRGVSARLQVSRCPI